MEVAGQLVMGYGGKEKRIPLTHGLLQLRGCRRNVFQNVVEGVRVEEKEAHQSSSFRLAKRTGCSRRKVSNPSRTSSSSGVSFTERSSAKAASVRCWVDRSDPALTPPDGRLVRMMISAGPSGKSSGS